MIALVKTARGVGHVELQDVPHPHPLPGFVTVRVEACGICGTDIHIYYDEFATDPPVVIGHELAGTIAELGEGVTGLSVGERVTTETFTYTCGRCKYCRSGYPNLCPERRALGSYVNGGFAEYVMVPARHAHVLPPNVSTLAGALTEPLACCINAVDLADVRPTHVVAVSGPGAIGLLTVQLAKAAGARVLVLGLQADAHRLATAVKLGADRTINVEREDVDAVVSQYTGNLGVDVGFECAGAQGSAQTLLRLLQPHGHYAQVGLMGKPIAWDSDMLCLKELKVTGSNADVPGAWDKGLAYLADGRVQTEPLVSMVLPLSDWQRGFKMVEEKQGLKIVLDPQR
jgi:L-iditol 2-dehydrogenase